MPMAWHPTNQNAVIVVDLAKDPIPLLELDSEALKERLYTKRSELAEDERRANQTGTTQQVPYSCSSQNADG